MMPLLGLGRYSHDHVCEQLLCGGDPLRAKECRDCSEGRSVKTIEGIAEEVIVSKRGSNNTVDHDKVLFSHDCVDTSGLH